MYLLARIEPRFPSISVEKECAQAVAGLTCLNDVTARDIQRAEGQWTRAKGFDTFCPIGPAIVTPDEIGDPHDLTMELRVNGERR